MSSDLQQAFFISLKNNGKQYAGFEIFITTYGPNFPAPIGAGPFGNAIWQQSDPADIFTYSLVNNPNPQLEPFGGSPPFTGQFITLENLGVAAGATVTINLLIMGSQPGEVKKIVVPGLSIEGGTTTAAGEEGSTTPL
jgi:hypothetical protein